MNFEQKKAKRIEQKVAKEAKECVWNMGRPVLG